VEWINSGEPIDQTDARLRVLANGQQLEIVNSRLTDAGRYTCVAKNDAGITDRDFDLHVLGIGCQSLYSVIRRRFSCRRRTKSTVDHSGECKYF